MMNVFVVDVKKSFDSMDFAAGDKEELERMRERVNAALREFDERAMGYRTTAESPLIVDESVRQNAIAQYHADAEKTKSDTMAARAEIDRFVARINSGMKSAFDAAVAAVAAEKLHGFPADYIIIPVESALVVNAKEYPLGSDITSLVISRLADVGQSTYQPNTDQPANG